MADDTLYEIELHVRSGKAGDEAVRRIEGPLDHATANDVAADIVGHLDTASRKRIKHLAGTDR
jgi:hypothetical protein